jgi:magnesium-transporting ATPase (P-type)
LDSEQPNKSSEEETPFSLYVKTGLSSDEVARKLEKYGPNEVPERKISPFRKFVSYFWGPIPWMIEAAAILSMIIQHYEDFAIIFTLLIVNAVVGFWQEGKADNAIEMLKKRLAPKARVPEMERGAKYLQGNLFPATLSACVWATLCLPTSNL